jgi:molybdopterin biosynthesis enzyme
MMDGYAVHAPITPGEYILEGSVRAGSDFNAKLDEGGE